MNERPSAKGIAVALVLGCVLTVFAAEGVLRLVMPHWREFYSGWFMQTTDVQNHGTVTTGRPGFDGYFAQNNGDFRIHIRVNDFGLRNPDPVDKARDSVWFVGDSMTFGWGVEQKEIYSSVAGHSLNFPTYNVASPGANVCGYQALMARMPDGARPRAVIVGLILENDIAAYDCRKAAREVRSAKKTSSTGLKVFLTRNTALYNFFAVSLKRVGFIRDALSAFGIIAKEHTYTRVLSDSGMAAATKRTAAEIEVIRNALPAGIPFAVLVVPARFEIRDGDAFYRKLRQSMLAALAKRDIPAIDPVKAFTGAGFEPTHFAHDGHWSPLGHALAGQSAAEWLRRQGIGN